MSEKKDFYKNGKIYKLVSNATDKVYYGSTCNDLAKRKSQHQSKFKAYKNGKYCYVTSFDLFELGNVDIVLVEDYSCESKNQLHARERFYIENNVCLNKYIPAHTKKEHNKEYYQQNKDKLNEKIICECGAEYQKRARARHEKSKKHIELMEISQLQHE